MSRRLVLVACAVLFAGCSNLGYYAQAVSGHFSMMHQARPIAKIIKDPEVPEKLRRELADVLEIRDFASRELALPDNKSYRSYADLGRPFAVWNVFAAPEFSIEPEKWCLVFVGCVNYRGYYKRADAERFAAQLQREGLDTHIGGVPAYSTLGFFSDPVLNTFLRYGEPEVARILFHELAHQKVFAKGDSEFNESFATAVETEGMRRWLATRADDDERRAYLARQQRKADFAALVERYRDRLEALYAGSRPEAEGRAAKAAIFADMRADYAKLKQDWGGYAGYDFWMNDHLNNAKIASFALYTKLTPAFAALLAAEHGDLPRFYERVRALAHMPKKERHAVLDRLMPAKPREVPLEPPHIVPPASSNGAARSG